MDPVSFGVGVVGLAGLVSTCIEGFHILQSMRSFNRDTEILCTKLDIEKDLLMQWAQQVGLLGRKGVDGRLFSQRTDKVISNTLKEIAILLKEGAEVQKKYGLLRDEWWSEDGRVLKQEPRRREREWIWDGLHSGDDDGGRKKIGWGRKFVWTVHDKEEFRELIGELGYFIGKLYQMIPSIEQRRTALGGVRKMGANIRTLRLIEAAAEGDDDSRLSELASNLALEDAEDMSSNVSVKTRSDDGRSHSDQRNGIDDGASHVSRTRSHGGRSSASRHRRSSPARLEWVESRSREPPRRSPRHAFSEMVGDVVRRNGRPVSGFR